MCGIAVTFAYRPRPSPIDRQSLLRMHASQAVRGPDGEGVWFSDNGQIGLAHRRLAILDLSPSGDQPMTGSDGSTHVVFNGEIYNTPELRSELERKGCVFVSHSDTEVLLHLYRMEGRNMLSRLRGMFAFALFDERRKGLLLARDPMGIKPLYVADRDGVFAAASQVRALLAGGGMDTSPEPAGHAGFFLWGHVPEPFTLYRGIRSLPPGSSVWVCEDKGAEDPVFFFDLGKTLSNCEQCALPMSIAETEERISAAMKDSVRHHMFADVPVGVFLSAGLDSSTLAVMASECTSQPLETVTLAFDEYRSKADDESVLAGVTAKKMGFNHHTHWIRQEDFHAARDHLLSSMDQPSIDGVNTFFVSRAARTEGLKAVLSGLGGDELLGGYPSFRQIPTAVRWLRPWRWAGPFVRKVASRWITALASPKYAGLLEYGGSYGGAYLLRRALFMPWELPCIMDPDLAYAGWEDLCVLESIENTIKDIHSPFLRVAAMELSCYMRNQLLRDSDWASMAHSLELRVPFVDVDLLRTVAPLVAGARPPFKRAMTVTVANKLPREILTRRKTGFGIPVDDWMRPTVDGRGLRGWALWIYAQITTL